jgi:hypothetical protein
MDSTDRKVRKFVFDHFLAETIAPAVPEIAKGCGLDQVLADAALGARPGRHVSRFERRRLYAHSHVYL